MAKDIENVIETIMGDVQERSTKPRDLVPFLLTANEILRRDIPAKRFLVSSFMPTSSFGMVFAPRGIGKSWFAFGLAKAIATGAETFLGWQIHEKGNVLFVDGEMSLVDLKERTGLLFGSKGPSNFYLMPSEELYKNGCPICLDSVEEHEAIFELLKHMDNIERRPKLIVLDNLSTLRRGVNENDNSETEKLLSFLVKLRHMGYAVLLVHHTNKSGDQRGASIIEVPMDYIIKLSHPPKGDAIFKKGAVFNVEFTKVRNKEPKNSDFQCELLEKEDGRLEFAINTSMTEVPDDMVLLRAIAEGHVRPNVRYFARKLDYSVGKIDKLLKNLRKEEAIEKKRYVTTERGKCMLHEWFSQKYPAPESYEEYKNEIPF